MQRHPSTQHRVYRSRSRQATRVSRRLRLARLALCTLAMVLAQTLPARAHDFWIEPETFQPVEGSAFEVALRIGERFAGKPYPRIPERIARFELVALEERAASQVQGAAGWEPAGVARAGTPGLHRLVYVGTPVTLELPAERFEASLRERGLDAALALRSRLPEPKPRGRERYVRCAKALVDVVARGASSNAGSSDVPGDAPVGLPLELVLEAQREMGASTDEISVQLLLHGRPLSGALVLATPAGHPRATQAVRTDARGSARFSLARRGRWLVTASHMQPLTGDANADWQSYWASLTFEIPESRDLQH